MLTMASMMRWNGALWRVTSVMDMQLIHFYFTTTEVAAPWSKTTLRKELVAIGHLHGSILLNQL